MTGQIPKRIRFFHGSDPEGIPSRSDPDPDPPSLPPPAPPQLSFFALLLEQLDLLPDRLVPACLPKTPLLGRLALLLEQ